MKEIRKKQKKMKKIMNIVVVFSAIYLFVYIGVYPTVEKSFSSTISAIVVYIGYFLVFLCLGVLYVYYSKYSKCEKFFDVIETELKDASYYLTSRQEKSISEYKNVVIDDLRKNGFSVTENVEINEIVFDAVAVSKNELLYIIAEENLDRNDLIAYPDSAIYDITTVRYKRKANAVIMYICDYADEGALSLSKVITPLGKKENIKIANAIVELSTSRCYFLGNNPSKCSKMIANYAMNCDVPIKEQYIGKERLPFQDELEKHMEDFNLKDFKNGNFYAH